MPQQYSEDYQITNWLPAEECFMSQWGRISHRAWLELEKKRIKALGIESEIHSRKNWYREELALFRVPQTINSTEK